MTFAFQGLAFALAMYQFNVVWGNLAKGSYNGGVVDVDKGVRYGAGIYVSGASSVTMLLGAVFCKLGQRRHAKGDTEWNA